MALITISRGTFSGGKAVAEKLAKDLGYPCYSREEIIRDAADQFDISEDMLDAAMTETPGFWKQNANQCISHLNFVRAALLRQLKGKDLVYHGYGGHLLLEGVTRLLRVRVIASMEYRIAAAMEELGMSRNTAAAHITAFDKRLAKWAKSVLGVEWDDPSLFDVIFNLDHISIDGTVRTIAQMSHLEEFTPDQDALQSLENLLISSRVWAAITLNKATRSAKVQIEAADGYVIISGNVSSMKIADAIIGVAAGVDGVKTVSNQIGIGSDWIW
jgi:cytidylate kinase